MRIQLQPDGSWAILDLKTRIDTAATRRDAIRSAARLMGQPGRVYVVDGLGQILETHEVEAVRAAPQAEEATRPTLVEPVPQKKAEATERARTSTTWSGERTSPPPQQLPRMADSRSADTPVPLVEKENGFVKFMNEVAQFLHELHPIAAGLGGAGVAAFIAAIVKYFAF